MLSLVHQPSHDESAESERATFSVLLLVGSSIKCVNQIKWHNVEKFGTFGLRSFGRNRCRWR